ncbi:hypothetical protein ACNKHM_09615 [Shigella sonnei]
MTKRLISVRRWRGCIKSSPLTVAGSSNRGTKKSSPTGQTGKTYDFADAPTKLLTTVQDCWVMHPGESWHGFEDIPDNWSMLDPIKVSILAPGMGEDGDGRNRCSGGVVTAWLVATALRLPVPLTSRLCSCSLWA